MYIVINELEKDVLREIISIGLARAADSFANLSHNAVLLAVPEIKIIEPKALPDVIEEFQDQYQIIRSEIDGEISGKLFLLFTEIQTETLVEVCLENVNEQNSDYTKVKETLLLNISQTITKALVTELHHLLHVELRAVKSESLFDNQPMPIDYILEDVPTHQPFVIAIKTQFRKMINSVELPVIIVLHAHSISKLLSILRRNNLYDFKLLQNEE